MNCRLVQAKLSQYLDQELSGREMIAIRQHCDRCESCSAEREGLSLVKSILGSSPAHEPIPGFEGRLHEAVFAHVGAQGHRGQAFPLRGAALAAVAGALLVVGVMRFLVPAEDATPVAINASTESIDYATDQTVQGVLDPFGGQPIVTVSHGR